MGLVDKFKDILGMQPEEDDIDEMDSDLSYSENEDDVSDGLFHYILSLTIFKISSSDCSGSRPVVSAKTASSACFKGAISRCESA